MASLFNFEVSNEDIIVRFSCPNHKKRIDTTIKNFRLDKSDADSMSKIDCRFTSDNDTVVFSFNGEKIEGNDIRHEAVFFENTDYPIIVRGKKDHEITDISLAVNDHEMASKDTSIICSGGEMYGAMNFGNQVGMTDFSFEYKIKGESTSRKLWFMTEVLSYKLDYRSDLKIIISDIEYEYALLSTAFLKDTYLSMRTGKSESSPLIWWQIFKSCYKDILEASRQIIDRPKRRLRSVPKYERAERMSNVPRELENEYQVHKDNPAYLYRTEEMVLSHDTIENRFLKYVLREIYRKFIEVKHHIITAMYLDDPKRIDHSIEDMEDELLRVNNNSFFRGIGQFKGFSQDNLVMKQAHGYKTILEKWVELQQGYELEEGMRKLEVKDISDLYEIWCFIKVKNIVQEILSEKEGNTKWMTNGKPVTSDFIPKLVYGGEVSFLSQDNIELANVAYNAEVEKDKDDSAISGTSTITTIQRPDIVLRLSKADDGGMKYTYLFDAKYRIDDRRINGYEVPPEDAINQMHRYRDAIYYTEKGKDHEHLKKEIIAGYVLFPGNIPLEALKQPDGNYYYQKSNSLIGIGAFPLRPDQESRQDDGSIIVDPQSSEQALRVQIRKWLSDENGKEKLLEESIPQHGLYYHTEAPQKTLLTLHHLENYLDYDILIGSYHDEDHFNWITNRKDEEDDVQCKTWWRKERCSAIRIP